MVAQDTQVLNGSFWSEVGLMPWRPFWGDGRFWLGVAAGVLVWCVAWLAAPQFFARLPLEDYALLGSVILWQPLLEELLFRGIIQGQAARKAWGKRQWAGMSGANLFASALFVAAHFVYHAPLWAAAVLVPSLVFGYFRDRFASVWPGLALHVFYNAGYFLIGGLIQK